MRWKCSQLGFGCYNDLARPKIEVFAECFPRRICMGDIDGCVELNGYFLIMEWKRYAKPLAAGQSIMYDRWVRLPGRMFTVLCIAGSAQTMHVTHAMNYTGPESEWMAHDLDWCKRFMRRWSAWAEEQVHA